jgi:GTP cyclohydrolase I
MVRDVPVLLDVRAPPRGVHRCCPRRLHPGPSGNTTVLSKLAHLVDGFARRPQVQERVTMQIADAVGSELEPAAVLVVIDAHARGRRAIVGGRQRHAAT